MNAMERFFRLFKQVAKQGKWQVRDNGYIRHKNGWCPLAFIASRRSHHDVNLSDYVTPGQRLGLSIREAQTIAHAADKSLPYMPDAPEIRGRLLTIAGLA